LIKFSFSPEQFAFLTLLFLPSGIIITFHQRAPKKAFQEIRVKKISLSLLLIMVISLAACSRPVPKTTAAGTPSSDPETSTIGAAGGTLALLDGRLELTIPAGALSSDVEISVQHITNNAFGGLGSAYRLEPSGTTFAKPITLTFKAGEDDLAKLSIGGMGMAFQDADGYWKRLPGAQFDTGSNTLSVTTDHFSDYAPVAVTLLQPLSKMVKPGETVQLELQNCYPVKLSTDPNGWRGYECDNYLGVNEDAQEWRVNSVTGGNATVGTITGAGESAKYIAPSKPPTPSTVNASVKLANGTGADAQNVELFSQITISQPGDFTGTLNIAWHFSGLDFTIQIDDAKLTLTDDGIDETNYTLSGTAKISPTTFNIASYKYTLSDSPAKSFSKYGFKVRKIPKPAVRLDYAEDWTYTSGDAQFMVIVNFMNRTGPGCSQLDDVPVASLDKLDGQYTMSCMEPGYGGTATWKFTKNQ